MTPRDADQPEAAVARRRLRGFRNHLVAYMAAMVILVPVNYLTTPERPWFLIVMVGWGSVLAVHVAYVMGLFGRGGR